MQGCYGPFGHDAEIKQSNNGSESILQFTLDRITALPVDEWLQPLADVFTTGIHSGLQSAYLDQHVKHHTLIFDNVSPQTRTEALFADRELFPTFVEWLNDPDSVSFVEMDDAISESIFSYNNVSDWDQLDDINPALSFDELIDIYIAGWQFGYKNYIFQMWFDADLPDNEDEQSWMYQQATARSNYAASQLLTDHLDDQGVRSEIAEQIVQIGWNDLEV